MKFIFNQILIVTFCGICLAEAASQEAYYKKSSYRSWYYAEKLLKVTIDPERITIENDLVATAFDYFVLLKNSEIKQDKAIEMWIKTILKGGIVRQSILDDPLNRSGRGAPGNPRGITSNKMIKDEDYQKLKLEFADFIRDIK